MTLITKALVIDQPWIDLILSGVKTWEMRSTATSFRGPFGLIRKGSGHIVGVARMTGCGSALSPAQMIATMDRHHIPEHMIRSGEVSKWTTPWHLSEVCPLARPVAYSHPSGAVTWVNLTPEVTSAITAQLGAFGASPPIAPVPTPPPVQPPRIVPTRQQPEVLTFERPAPVKVSAASSKLLGETVISEANLKWNHFYLRAFLDSFPEALIAGKDQSPPVLATVEVDGMPPTQTDICPRHLFFRARGWTRQFFENHDAAPGDRVQVHQIAPLRYRISLVKG